MLCLLNTHRACPDTCGVPLCHPREVYPTAAGPFYLLLCHSTDFNLRYALETVAHLQGLQTQTDSAGTEVTLKQGVDLEVDPHQALAQLGKQLANIVKTFK